MRKVHISNTISAFMRKMNDKLISRRNSFSDESCDKFENATPWKFD